MTNEKSDVPMPEGTPRSDITGRRGGQPRENEDQNGNVGPNSENNRGRTSS